MAEQKKTKSTTTTRKKTTTAAKSAPKEAKPSAPAQTSNAVPAPAAAFSTFFPNDPARIYRRRMIWGVLMLMMTVFSALGWFIPDSGSQTGISGGIFIGWLRGIETGFCGWGWFMYPFCFLFASYILFFHRGRPVQSRIFCTLLLPFLFGTTAHVMAFTGKMVSAADLESPGFMAHIHAFFDNLRMLLSYVPGSKTYSGGMLGGLFASVLTTFFGKIGAVLVLTILYVVILLVLTETAPENIWGAITGYAAPSAPQNAPAEDDEKDEIRPIKFPGFFSSKEEHVSFGDAPTGQEASQPEQAPEPAEESTAGTISATRKATRKKRFRDYDMDLDAPVTSTAPTRNRTQEKKQAKYSDAPVVSRFRQASDPDTDTIPARTVSAKERGGTLFDNRAGVSTPGEYFARREAKEEEEARKAAERTAEKAAKKKKAAEKKAEAAKRAADGSEYLFPSVDLLQAGSTKTPAGNQQELEETENLLAQTLQSFGIDSNIENVVSGPAVTRYELRLEMGIKLSKITNLSGDIALSLGAPSVRIAPVPGQNSMVGIEVPNRQVAPVPIRSVIDSEDFRSSPSSVSFAVGKDISNQNVIGDIAKMPHLLIAGTTGSGKSVCVNSMIISLLYKSSHQDVQLIMIDPKMVELSNYNGIPHLRIPVVTDPKKAAGALQWAVYEMMQRYQDFANLGVREIEAFNTVVRANEDMGLKPKPQLVVIIDELADLMLVAAKEVEESICRVAQMGRAAGVHLVIATQRPSSDVITGLMKANIPSRIAFAVASTIESRIILDTAGAEKLVGKGDMLFAPLGKQRRRVQGCFISDKEVNDVIEEVKKNAPASYDENVMKQVEEFAKQNEKGGKGGPSAMNVTMPDGSSGQAEEDNGRDPLYNDAVDVVVELGMASASTLQRRLKVGYARAARLVDQMEEGGVVGPFEGSKPRKVLVSKERWDEMKLQSNGGEFSPLDLAKAMSKAADDSAPPFDYDD